MNAVILRRKKGRDDDGRVVYEYHVYCLRCHSMVHSTGRIRNYAWATKPPARKAAREHVDMHTKHDARIATEGILGGWDTIEEVNP